MDLNNMDLNHSIPALKAGLKKVAIYLLLWLLLEAGIFVLTGYFIGFANACWILVGSFILGYLIRPVDYSLQAKPKLPTARKLASTLLMIPGYMSSLIAILVIIPPIRRFIINYVLPLFKGILANRIASQFGSDVPEGLTESFAEQFKAAQTGNAAQTGKTKRMSSKRAQHDGDIIDIDYEIEGKKNSTSKRAYESASGNGPKALGEEEIIDVEAEWETK